MKNLLATLFLLFSLLFIHSALADTAVQLDINGPIGPATQEYVTDGLLYAQNSNARLVILRVDTPGGLSSSTRGIIKSILGADIPVVAFVGPSGARAERGGTFIVYAANVAAMAPGTTLGVATSAIKPSISEIKALNNTRTYLNSLAQLRSHNVTWAEAVIEKGERLSATEALRNKVIDVIATNVTSLLDKIDGMNVTIGQHSVTIDTKNMSIFKYVPGWRANLLAVITNPTMVYVFLMIAFYGIFLEFAHPGLVIPAVIGVISLFLGLYGLQMLPVNYLGLSLIFLGFVLFIAEIFVSSFGILALSGLVCFVIGSILLMDTNVVGFGIPWEAIVGFSIITALFVFFLLQLLIRSRHRPTVSGLSTMIGQEGEVLLDGDKAWLQVNGELWKIANQEGLQAGDRAKISRISGLQLTVKKI